MGKRVPVQISIERMLQNKVLCFQSSLFKKKQKHNYILD